MHVCLSCDRQKFEGLVFMCVWFVSRNFTAFRMLLEMDDACSGNNKRVRSCSNHDQKILIPGCDSAGICSNIHSNKPSSATYSAQKQKKTEGLTGTQEDGELVTSLTSSLVGLVLMISPNVWTCLQSVWLTVWLYLCVSLMSPYWYTEATRGSIPILNTVTILESWGSVSQRLRRPTLHSSVNLSKILTLDAWRNAL